MTSPTAVHGLSTKSGDRTGDPVTAEITTHVAALRRYALVLVGDPHEADDLVQEALTRVLSHMRAWRPVRDLRAYVPDYP